ncbi:hypothetical protein HMJ29_05910 [Hymenobacter taeanensis]|uniref:DUF2314 domain-containing protein n=1 Tax=Hymenobacter taeanensis TaxID=2735321 RepID=A0A6M6BHH8_9BACT|nr:MULTISPECIES: hypothetical protein [Hymenobacter]QJX46495.1 hypothetical protein HMJ29_05910 [Hymenobacter taeanensis]UOQ80358.1 hypothetical protein MUN83_16230 [Hymenobacter sp. 5414T-23]
MRTSFALLLTLLLTGAALGQQPASPTLVSLVTQLQEQDGALPELPCKEARRTLPQLRQRYQRGLPAGATCYLTAVVLNEGATPEPVVVLVSSWQAGQVAGRIVRVGPNGQTVANAPTDFAEAAVVDWLLLRPDGSEEGNYLGKFFDLEERLAALSSK